MYYVLIYVIRTQWLALWNNFGCMQESSDGIENNKMQVNWVNIHVFSRLFKEISDILVLQKTKKSSECLALQSYHKFT